MKTAVKKKGRTKPRGMSFSEMLRNPPHDDPDYQVEAAKNDYAIALERLRELNGIPNSELATRLGTSAAYVTKIFRGDVNFTIDSMVRLAHALGGRFDPLVRHASAKPLWQETIPPVISTDVLRPHLVMKKSSSASPWFGPAEFSGLNTLTLKPRNDHAYQVEAEAA